MLVFLHSYLFFEWVISSLGLKFKGHKTVYNEVSLHPSPTATPFATWGWLL